MSSEQKIIAALAFCFLLFLGGVLTGVFRNFPYPVFSPFVDAANGILLRARLDDYNQAIRWNRPVRDEKGVTVHMPAKTFGDYTLLTSSHDTRARLINMQGEVVHAWDLPYSRVFEDQSHLIAPAYMEDEYFYLRDFHLFADGSLILMYSVGGLTPWGAGLVKVDRDGKILWRLPQFFYNNLDVTEEGRIYALYHQVRTTPLAGLDSFLPPFLEDTIGIVNAEGRMEESISVAGAFAASPFAPMLDHVVQDGTGDYTHTNSVYALRADVPGVDWLKKGHLLLSLRNVSMMAVIDPARKKVVHAAFLPFRRQHIIRATDKGTLQVFDNQGASGPGGLSRFAEFDPVTLAVLRDIKGTEQSPMTSDEWGYYQELPNGNMLIAVAESGSMVEVSKEDEVVWEYFMPERHKGFIPVVTAFRRYAGSDLSFLP